MNNTVGIKEILAHHEALTIVARSLEPSKPSVMCEAVKLLGAVCLISSDSHKKVLDAITMNGEFNGRDRFLPIVQGLMNKQNENLRVSPIIAFTGKNQAPIFTIIPNLPLLTYELTRH
jgi:diaphanous 2